MNKSKNLLLGLLAFVGQRLAFGALVLLVIVYLAYLGLDMAGGTDLAPAAGGAANKTLTYVGRLLHGDLGLTTSGSDTAAPRPVAEVIVERLPRSLGLLGTSLLFASLVGTALGVAAARARARGSLVILLSTLVGVSVPSFFAAFLLQWAAITYTRQVGRSLVPVGGFGWDKRILLPALVLAARPIAQITRIAFVSVREALEKDYVRTARGKGLHRRRIMVVHVMRNVAIPILTTIGVSLRFSLSSLPVVELYFGWTGAGFLLLKGISQRDDNLTVAFALALGALFILVNLLLELSYRLIDPRLRARPAHTVSGERVRLLEAIKAAVDALRDLLANNPVMGWLKRRGSRAERAPKTSPQEGHGEALSGPRAGHRRRWTAAVRNLPLLVGGLLVVGLTIVVFFGPQLSPNNPSHTQGLTNIDGKFVAPPFPPGGEYPWGTDALGRGLMSLVLAGARQTLGLAVLAVAARTLVGVVLGAIAGWTNGSSVDRFILGLAEVIAAFPTLLLAMILILALGIRQGMPPFVVALCFVGWGEIMQFVRSQVTAIRPRPYIESAVSVGARTPRILGRHILPHLFSALISIVALEMGAVLMLLGELGFVSIFIGGGTVIAQTSGQLVLHSDVPEWGALLSSLRYMARSYPWTALYPMSAFFLSILSFNLFGEGVRRLVESGHLVVNRIVNRYTVVGAVIAVFALRWLNVNSGVMPFYQQRAREFDGERALSHVVALTDPAMEGRALGSPGMDLAAEYIAAEFEALGLQSAGQEGTFVLQRTHSFERLEEVPVFDVDDGGPQPVYGKDYAVFTGPYPNYGGAHSPVRLVLLGRPSVYRPTVWRLAYPELDRSDFAGEILLTLSEREMNVMAWVPKDGILGVTDDPALLARRYTVGGRDRSWAQPRLWISEEMADRLLAGSGYTVETLGSRYEELAEEEMYQEPLSTRASIAVNSTMEGKWPVQQVLGYIPGTHSYDFCADCLGKQLIVVLAQYDSPPVGPDGEICAAANDNASGVAVMLEAIRVIQETDYQPYKSMFFVAYSGEGLEGGEYVLEPDVTRFTQARAGVPRFELEAIIRLRGVGGGTGRRLEVAAGGNMRLAELVERSARRVGVRTVRADEAIDISVIYDEHGASAGDKEAAPTVRLFWEGWHEHSRLPTDTLANVDGDTLEEAGRTLALTLMILGRETEY
jgi:ABC-type dipeptide/oligopeptide/nickel transport system permease component